MKVADRSSNAKAFDRQIKEVSAAVQQSKVDWRIVNILFLFSIVGYVLFSASTKSGFGADNGGFPSEAFESETSGQAPQLAAEDHIALEEPAPTSVPEDKATFISIEPQDAADSKDGSEAEGGRVLGGAGPLDDDVLQKLLAVNYSSAIPGSVTRTRGVDMYPTCTPSGHWLANTFHGGHQNRTDKEIIITNVKEAPRLEKPFKFAAYFCGIIPFQLYKDLVETWPPDRVMDNYAAKRKSCNKAGCRYSLEGNNLLKIRAGSPKAKVIGDAEAFQRTKRTWQTLWDTVFSKEFEDALFSKLGVKFGRVKKREMRIFSDKKGMASGRVHTDMDAHKGATMMLYLPPRHQTVGAYDYGTCLHTLAQFKRRRKLSVRQGARLHMSSGRMQDGESHCFAKFRYLPNSAYAFKVSKDSWHSAPNSKIKNWRAERNTVLLNWY